MSEKAKNLRKLLSKKSVKKEIKEEAIQPQEQPKSTTNEIDPLAFITGEQSQPLQLQQTEEIDPLNFLNSNNDELQKKEKEKQIDLLNELDNLVKSNETNTFNKNISSTSTNKPSSLLNRMKKNKEAGPSKLMEFIKNNHLDEQAAKKVQFNNETGINKQQTKETPEQNDDKKEQTTPAKTFLPEMNDIRKRQLFQRMASARQSLNIMTLEKEVDNKTSEFIIEKAKIIETKIHTDDTPSQSEHNKDTSSMKTDNEGNLQNKPENDNQNNSNEKKIDIVNIIMNKPKKNIKRKGTHKLFTVSLEEI